MLIDNGATGLILVLIVLFFFLNGRIALWVALGIPVAFLAALGGMNAMGLSLDMISMFALIMGIGIVVDDAIVVSEHSTTLHRRGMNYKDASRIGAQRMFPPVLAACLTTVAAFLPVLMIGSDVGQIIAPVPITLSLIIIASLIECFLILPMHLRHSMKKITQTEQTKIRKFDIYFNKFRDEQVLPLVSKTYATKKFTVIATICLFLISVSLLFTGRVNFEFFDTPESDTIHANFSFSPGTPEDTTELMVKELGRAALEAEKLTTSFIGEEVVKYGIGNIGASDTGRGNLLTNTTGSHIGSYTVELVSGDKRDVRNMEFIKAWESATKLMPGIESFIVFEGQTGGPPGRDLDIRLSSDDLQTMKRAALVLRNELRALPGLLAVEDDFPFGKQEILLEITPEGEAMGFTAENVARQVRNAFSGSIAKRFSQDTEEVLVRVKLPTEETSNQTIRDIYLLTPDNNNVLLSEVVLLKQRLGFTKIRKEGGVRKASVTADVDPSITTTNKVLQLVRKNIAPKLEQEFNVKVEFKGKAEEQSEALGDLTLALIITLASIYIILAWLFSSYTTPLLIMTVVPFGLIGAIIGHYILGFNLSMFSLMAFFGLTGVLVNDSIILVKTIKEAIADGYQLSQAVVEGVRERLRPVMLTTITTIVGLMPILFEQSLQARLVQPLAVTFIFGMIFVPYLVLIFIPSMMGIADGLKLRIRNLANIIGFHKGQYE
jgi:multidrug efflux pump subunit AcrB